MNGTVTTERKADLENDTSAEEYLTFILDNETYGMEILHVLEIISAVSITRIPFTDNCVKGVINLRGKVIPVIDLGVRFGMSPVEETDETCIVVVQVEDTVVGLYVDRVSDVIFINNNQIDDPPLFDAGGNSNFVQGIGKIEGKAAILLNMKNVLLVKAVI